MRFLLTLLFFIAYFTAISQVKVKGYYRKNGTYVQPHVRSNPDGNPYNNYSFPGNTNPYTGKTATGSQEAYLNNYYKRETGNQVKYIPGRQVPLPISFKSYGTIKSTTSIRLSPRQNSSEVFKVKPGEIAVVLDDADVDFYKVDINGFTGFLSKDVVENLKINEGAGVKPYVSVPSNTSIGITSSIQYSSTPPAQFIFETQIKQGGHCLLRLSPRDNSSNLYTCKSEEKVYVLEKSENGYYKVSIRGFIGYLKRDCMP